MKSKKIKIMILKINKISQIFKLIIIKIQIAIITNKIKITIMIRKNKIK